MSKFGILSSIVRKGARPYEPLIKEYIMSEYDPALLEKALASGGMFDTETQEDSRNIFEPEEGEEWSAVVVGVTSPDSGIFTIEKNRVAVQTLPSLLIECQLVDADGNLASFSHRFAYWQNQLRIGSVKLAERGGEKYRPLHEANILQKLSPEALVDIQEKSDELAKQGINFKNPQRDMELVQQFVDICKIHFIGKVITFKAVLELANRSKQGRALFNIDARNADDEVAETVRKAVAEAVNEAMRVSETPIELPS